MKKRIQPILRHSALLGILAGISISVAAQGTDSLTKKWHFVAEPYFYLINMKGTTAIGNLPPLSVYVPFSDLLSHLKMVAMLYLEAQHDRLALSSDIIYSKLGENGTGAKGVFDGTVEAKLFIWELAALYKVNPWLEFGLGTRLNSINMGVTLSTDDTFPNGPYTASKSSTKTWVDPIIITRMKGIVDNKWIFALRADIGGFGIGSQLTWQVQPDIYYKVSRLFQIGLGYRFLSTDYHTGEGSDYFLYNVVLNGPELRLGFHF